MIIWRKLNTILAALENPVKNWGNLCAPQNPSWKTLTPVWKQVMITGSVVLSHLSDLKFETSGLLVLLHVLLTLEPGRRIQHDVLDLILNIFSPRCEPGDLKVKNIKYTCILYDYINLIRKRASSSLIPVEVQKMHVNCSEAPISKLILPTPAISNIRTKSRDSF